MESIGSSSGTQHPLLPPGFRFHPTDEELVVHYLKRKAASDPLPVRIIAEVDLYKFDPWELPSKAAFGEQEWYFFSHRDRKYPNGDRPNRAATSGYWKATGTDKPILTSNGTQKIGVKKALVFYGGKPPKGIKTNWIMHEYRLIDNKLSDTDLGCKKASLWLDDWVLCRIYKKNDTSRSLEIENDDSMEDMLESIPTTTAVCHQNPKLGASKATNFGGLIESENENVNCFKGIFLSRDGMQNGSVSKLAAGNINKRALPQSSEDWNESEPLGSSSGKRFHGDNNQNGCVNGADENTSFFSLLNHLPQGATFQQSSNAVLGSFGDGLFGQSHHQLPGMHWKS